jgi:hypothetical protein
VLLGTVILLTAVLGWRRSIRELQSNLDRLQELKDRSDSGPFGLRDHLAVYGLNLAMGIGGTVAGLPEVSEETLLLCVRDGPVRTWRSDFAMRSPRVRTEVRRLSELAQGGGVSASKALLPTTRITWTRYDPAEDSFRVALALNSPLELSGSVRTDHDGAWLDLIGHARIEYPRRAVLRLFSFEGRPVSLDEGLFWVLQQDGWLHPYTAEWRWSVRSDDPQLNDTSPVRSWREQLLAWLFRDGHSPERVR